MAIKLPKIKRSTVLLILNLLLGFLGGQATPSLPLIGDVIESDELPVCPPALSPAGREAPAAHPSIGEVDDGAPAVVAPAGAAVLPEN